MTEWISPSAGGQCFLLRCDGRVVEIRDSKHPEGPALVYSLDEWDDGRAVVPLQPGSCTCSVTPKPIDDIFVIVESDRYRTHDDPDGEIREGTRHLHFTLDEWTKFTNARSDEQYALALWGAAVKAAESDLRLERLTTIDKTATLDKLFEVVFTQPDPVLDGDDDPGAPTPGCGCVACQLTQRLRDLQASGEPMPTEDELKDMVDEVFPEPKVKPGPPPVPVGEDPEANADYAPRKI